ncbi:MAG: hypothetical protein ACLUHA_17710 [Bacteroides stercoris]
MGKNGSISGNSAISGPPQSSKPCECLANIWEGFAPAHDETTVDQQAHYTEIHLPRAASLTYYAANRAAAYYAARRTGQRYPDMPFRASAESHLQRPIPPFGRCRNQDRRYCGQRRRPHGVRQPYACPQLRNCCRTVLSASALCLLSTLRSPARHCGIAGVYAERPSPNPQSRPRGGVPDAFQPLPAAHASECHAAFELWRATGNAMYKARVRRVASQTPDNLAGTLHSSSAWRRSWAMLSNVGETADKKAYMSRNRNQAGNAKSEFRYRRVSLNSWAGNAMILRNGIINYQILKLFPELGSPELVFRNLNYIYGCHPYHNRSFVSGSRCSAQGWRSR